MKFSCILIIALASHSVYSFKIGKTENKLYNGGHNGTVLDLPGHINISGSLPEVYIVGGVPATRNEFPWLVYLNADGSFCGGTLIAMVKINRLITKIKTKSVKIIEPEYDFF